jgi:hypothetical protein
MLGDSQMPTLEDAINAIRTGDREEGRQILEEILETDESNEDVWLWLSSVVDSDEDREICLENVLALNPDNVVAQRGLEALRSGTFNVHDIVREAARDEEEAEAVSKATFLDEFTSASEAREEFEFPSTMKPRKRAAKGAGLNVRMIVLLLVGLCVVLALGTAAVYNLFLSGGDGEPVQEVPVEVEQPEATPTETPTPMPTSTPTVTNTPFRLPTSEPTELPTPTATPVVSPTVPH